MARYKVISFDKIRNAHTVTGEGFYRVEVDLFVGASFADFPPDTLMSVDAYYVACESIVGKTIEIERLTPYSYNATGVKIIKED